MDKKIINFTPTGTQTTRSNSFAPLTPNEIIDEVHEAYELGITLTHIHARDPLTLENTYKKNVYEEIINGIRKHCPHLSICVSLSGRLFTEFEKRSEGFWSCLRSPDSSSAILALIGLDYAV